MVLRRSARAFQAAGRGGNRGGQQQAGGPKSLVPPYAKTPTADLTHTRVHRGSGAPGDPYHRAATNLETRAPEPAVLQHALPTARAALASVVDASTAVSKEAFGIHLTLAQWLEPAVNEIGFVECPLAAYVNGLKIRDELPVPKDAAARLQQFESATLQELAAQRGEDTTLVKHQWAAAAKKYRAFPPDSLFDVAAAEAHLQACSTALLAFCPHGADAADAVVASVKEMCELLRRDAVLERNRLISALADVVSSPILRSGNATWERFAAVVKKLEAELLRDDALRAQWELTADVEPPALKPSVALLFIVVTASHASAESAATVATGDISDAAVVRCLSRDHIAQFALAHLPSIVARPQLPVFAKLTLADAYRTLSASLALETTRRESRKKHVAPIVAAMADLAQAKDLLQILCNTGNPDLVRLTMSAGRVTPSSTGTISFKSVDAEYWAANYATVGTQLLCDPRVTDHMMKAAKTMASSTANSKKKDLEAHYVFNDANMAILKELHDREGDDAAATNAALQQLQSELFHTAPSGTLLELLRGHGVSLAPLHAATRDVQRAQRAEKIAPKDSFRSIITEVARRQPAWVKAGIVTPGGDSSLDPTSASAVALLLRAYLRLTYVPSNASAWMAKQFRARQGLVSAEPTVTNVETEIGFTEHYDMREYKRYDWQGWYQRMVDVQNRNASIRCSLNRLRVLDAKGQPFIDMQTERRLRVLAGERVGNSIIKLDADRFEDLKDNVTFGETKLSELFSESKKAQLGAEYWPSVEVKVRKPSGQSRLHYSTLDWDRVEARSKEAFEKYTVAKEKQLYVPPTTTWLQVRGGATKTAGRTEQSAEGYTEEMLFNAMSE